MNGSRLAELFLFYRVNIRNAHFYEPMIFLFSIQSLFMLFGFVLDRESRTWRLWELFTRSYYDELTARELLKQWTWQKGKCKLRKNSLKAINGLNGTNAHNLMDPIALFFY